MLSRNVFTRRPLALLAASGVMLVIPACGEESDFGLGQRFPVSGTVTHNGKPLEKGHIHFYPENTKEVGAGGPIENGSYALSTVGDKDGARVGKYKVGIVAKEDSEAQAKAEFEKIQAKTKHAASSNYNTGRIPPEFQSKARREAKSLIPAGYGDLRTTTLTAEVKGEPNTIHFKLTDAEAPPEPPKSTGKGKTRTRDPK